MAAIKALARAYREDSDSEGDESPEEELTPDHTAHLNTDVKITQLQSKIQLKSAPTVTAKVGIKLQNFIRTVNPYEPVAFLKGQN